MHPPPIQLAAIFTAPLLAGIGAGAVAIPIAIHLLSRMRRQRVSWGAMRFIQLAYRQQRNRLRLESWLLLLTRCLLMLVAGLALAGPLMDGALARLMGRVQPGGRTVVFVLDDALSTQALETADRTRFARHKADALAVLDTLPPADRVALWAAGRPAAAVFAEPTTDHAAIRQAIENMTPRHGRSDLPAALASVADVLNAQPPPAQSDLIVLLSDFPMSAEYLNTAPEPALAELGKRAELIVSRPSPAVGNFQIASIKPRRSMVLTEGPGGGAVSVAVTVRRLGAGAGDAFSGSGGGAPLMLSLVNPDGTTRHTARRMVQWVAGQVEATVNAELPLGGARGEAVSTVITRAHLDMTSLDSLPGDNNGWAVVELRRGLKVGLVDEASGSTAGGQGLDPADWIHAALAPGVGGSGGEENAGIEVVDIPPVRLNGETMADCDALIVLRPDRLVNGAWEELAGYVRSGGLLWVTAPIEEGSAVWTDALRRAFNVDWQAGLEPVTLSERTGGLGLDLRRPAPEAVDLLAADWADLLRPIRVMRTLDLLTPESEAWLALAEGSDAADDPQPEPIVGPPPSRRRRALLAGVKVGDGALLLLATPIDTQWTNLPTKPLFVPLLHEALRGVLGASANGAASYVSGDRPTLGEAYRGELRLLNAPEGQAVTVPLNDAEAGQQPAQPLDRPGVYVTAEDVGARPIAVNVEPGAGDTRPISEAQLGQWLSGIGPWRFFDPVAPAAAAQQTEAGSNLGWTLLWALLALLLFETILARWVSHAKREDGSGVTRKLLGSIRAAAAGHHEPREETGRAA